MSHSEITKMKASNKCKACSEQLTLRDQFAMDAFKCLLSDCKYEDGYDINYILLAEQAYYAADAMMKVRNNE